MNKKLFSGKPGLLGGLSNEIELWRMCPSVFNDDNRWSDYAMKLFFFGGDTSGWKWKTEDKQERSKQLSCFKALLGSCEIKHEGKESVAGWMLSEMLMEIPKDNTPDSSGAGENEGGGDDVADNRSGR